MFKTYPRYTEAGVRRGVVPTRAVIHSDGCEARPGVRRTVEREPNEPGEAFWARICQLADRLGAVHGIYAAPVGMICFFYTDAAHHYARFDDQKENLRLALHWLKDYGDCKAVRQRATLRLLDLDNVW